MIVGDFVKYAHYTLIDDQPTLGIVIKAKDEYSTTTVQVKWLVKVCSSIKPNVYFFELKNKDDLVKVVL